MSRPRTLLAITVYNGQAFVGRALESALRIDQSASDIDVLVLDDCSPAPGWSATLAEMCDRLGVGYYRSPRNLGIVRNVNLGLLRALDHGYDFVVVSNSDVIYPVTLLNELLAAYESGDGIGSVTAWSNNVSAFSLLNDEPDRYLADQAVVDWLAASIAGDYHGHVMDVPAGISFCILIPRGVLEVVGLMDPVFGRGYCEETDWTLRSLAAGYRVVLAPSAFVYHQGQGSTGETGMVAAGHTTVPQNEAIIDMRYPLFRAQVGAFLSSGILDQLRATATARVVADAGSQFGYQIDVSWFPRPFSIDLVRVLVQPDGRVPVVRAAFRGFVTSIPVGPDPARDIREFFHGAEPDQVNLFERGPSAQALLGGLDTVVVRHPPSYPARV